MRTPRFNFLALSVAALAATALLTSCGTTATRVLPPYEPPIAKADFQTVRTTAYTDTESDHVAYGARNALGGVLRSASVPASAPAAAPERTMRALPVDEPRPRRALSVSYLSREKTIAGKAKAPPGRVRAPEPPRIGSAAADWSRWPVGTTFRVVSTGQIYRVDDYGWALAGRNTIDLYMASRNEMNSWGVRHEPIEILSWGDPRASLALLEQRQKFRHCRRMALEIQGLHEEAAALH